MKITELPPIGSHWIEKARPGREIVVESIEDRKWRSPTPGHRTEITIRSLTVHNVRLQKGGSIIEPEQFYLRFIPKEG